MPKNRNEKHPFELCRAVKAGLVDQLLYEETVTESLMNVGNYEDEKFYDDITGVELPYDLVIAARKLEVEYYRKMKVYNKVPYEEAKTKLGSNP